MPTFVYKPGHPDEQLFDVERLPAYIGRSRDQTVCLTHGSLSRQHARLSERDGSYELSDLGSKNGTFVNGLRIDHQRVRNGDQVTFGDLELLFLTQQEQRVGEESEGQLMATRALLRAGELTGDLGSTDADARLRRLIEVNKALPLSQDIDELLAFILELLFQQLEVDRGVILLFDEAGDLQPRVVRGAEDSLEGEAFFSRSIINHVLQQKVAALFIDAGNDRRLDDAFSVEAKQIRASICAPLQPRDQLIGVLYIDNRSLSYIYTEDDLEFVLAFASQAASAIERSRLHQRLERETITRMQLIMNAKLSALNSLVAGVAHELRNPLNFISNFALGSRELLEDLVDDQPNPAALEELRLTLDRIHQHSLRADAVVEGMLAHARVDSSPRQLVELNLLVARSLQRALERAKAAGFEPELETRYGPELRVEAAEADLDRALFNVLDNSLYALRERDPARSGSPRLELSLELEHGEAKILIADNADGLAPEDAARVFEPFFTTKPTGSGVGLGLSLCRTILVEGHHGAIELHSVQNKGTSVEIRLPLQARDA